MINAFKKKLAELFEPEYEFVDFEFEHEMVCELTQIMVDTPNDSEFGAKARQFISEYQKMKSDELKNS